MEFRKRIIEELNLTEVQANTLLKDYIVVCEKLAKEYHSEQLILFGVSRSFKTKFQLAEFMHDEYEKHAQNNGWNTQETCKVDFLDLPEENKKTMLLVAESVLNAY